MKRTTMGLLVLLLGVGLFSSAKQRNATCDKLSMCAPEKKCKPSKQTVTTDAGFGLSPLTFFMADF